MSREGFRAQIALAALALLLLCGPLLAATAPLGNWRFEEGSGTTAADSSGNGNTGTLTNSPAWTTGEIGNALSFSASDGNYVEADGSGDLANLYNSGMTVMAWIYPTATGGHIIDKDNKVVGGWRLDMETNTVGFYVAEGQTDVIRESASTIVLNTWQHVAVTWDGSTSGGNIHIYINGVLADGTSQDGTGPFGSDAAAPFTIANRPYDAAVGFTGVIDEVRVYNKVLSASEIQTIASDTQPPTAPTSLTATAASSSAINLSWGSSTDNVAVANYFIERCSGSGCSNFSQITTTTGTSYQDTGLSASTAYSYRVRAIDSAYNYSSYSNTASATTQSGGGDTTPPTAPTNLAANATSSTQVSLSWTASTDNVGVTGYYVERCSDTGCSNFAQIGSAASTGYTDSGLTASTSYSYRVRATDAAGNLSSYSNTASATTPSSSKGPILNWRFDEGSGSSATDSSGNGNTGTLISGPSWVTGKIGDALSFSASAGNYVDTSGSGDLANLYNGGMTVMAWIYPTATGGHIIDKDNKVVGGWRLDMETNTVGFYVAEGQTDVIRESTSTIALNTWQHVAVTWDGSTSGGNIHIYINGVLADGTSQDGTGPFGSDAAAPFTVARERRVGVAVQVQYPVARIVARVGGEQHCRQ
jgi:chitodextrinase